MNELRLIYYIMNLEHHPITTHFMGSQGAPCQHAEAAFISQTLCGFFQVFLSDYIHMVPGISSQIYNENEGISF